MKLDPKQLAHDRQTLALVLEAARLGQSQLLLDSEIEALDRIHALLDPGQVSDAPTMRKFTSAYLRDELELPDGDAVVKTWVIEEQDHLTLHGLIFRNRDQPIEYAWQTTYSVSTDDDEGCSLDGNVDVECMLVRIGTKITNVWLPTEMKS